MSQPTYLEALKIAWFLLWRIVVFATAVGFVCGFLVAAVGTLFGVPSAMLAATGQAVTGVVVVLCGYPFILYTLFDKQFHGFRLAVIRYRRIRGHTAVSTHRLAA